MRLLRQLFQYFRGGNSSCINKDRAIFDPPYTLGEKLRHPIAHFLLIPLERLTNPPLKCLAYRLTHYGTAYRAFGHWMWRDLLGFKLKPCGSGFNCRCEGCGGDIAKKVGFCFICGAVFHCPDDLIPGWPFHNCPENLKKNEPREVSDMMEGFLDITNVEPGPDWVPIEPPDHDKWDKH